MPLKGQANRDHVKAWRKANPAKRAVQRRREHLAQRARMTPTERKAWNRKHNLRRFNLTPEAFNGMARAQKRRCAICGKRPRQLEVDHNHRTGALRALLCGLCNRGIGNFQDNPAIAAAARDYLIQHGCTGS